VFIILHQFQSQAVALRWLGDRFGLLAPSGPFSFGPRSSSALAVAESSLATPAENLDTDGFDSPEFAVETPAFDRLDFPLRFCGRGSAAMKRKHVSNYPVDAFITRKKLKKVSYEAQSLDLVNACCYNGILFMSPSFN
jgi:hypothetical protein